MEKYCTVHTNHTPSFIIILPSHESVPLQAAQLDSNSKATIISFTISSMCIIYVIRCNKHYIHENIQYISACCRILACGLIVVYIASYSYSYSEMCIAYPMVCIIIINYCNVYITMFHFSFFSYI